MDFVLLFLFFCSSHFTFARYLPIKMSFKHNLYIFLAPCWCSNKNWLRLCSIMVAYRVPNDLASNSRKLLFICKF